MISNMMTTLRVDDDYYVDNDAGTSDLSIGIFLAVSSSAFIGTSFIIKKKGLRGADGTSASAGGHAYLRNPQWWAGLLLMIVGEAANFIAYSFAPAIVVTPMGALSVVISAVLASFMLDETLTSLGKIGCALCCIGSVVVAIHAPPETLPDSVTEILQQAMRPEFLIYLAVVISVSLYLIFRVSPEIGHQNILVDLIICSLVGSISVMACKALGIGIRLTLNGHSQLGEPSFYLMVVVVGISIACQMHYLNKSLDTFNTAKVTPIYYVFFTSFVITASVILFKDWKGQTTKDIATSVCGFLTIYAGIYIIKNKS